MAAVSTPSAPPQSQSAHAIERPDFDIVPRSGLAISGVAMVLLVVAIAANKLWPLEFLHVASGAAWTIIDLFLGLVLGPIMGSMSVPARVEFTTRLMPKMVLIMPTVVTMTLASGWQLGTKLGTVGDAYDNALAESFVDSYKTELISDRVWRSRAEVEFATVEWVAWFNQDRLHGSLGD